MSQFRCLLGVYLETSIRILTMNYINCIKSVDSEMDFY